MTSSPSSGRPRRPGPPLQSAGATEPHRARGGAGRDRPAPVRRQALLENHRRDAAAARRRLPRAGRARARDVLLPGGRRRPRVERPVGRRVGAAPVPGRSRPYRRAVPGRIRMGRRPVRRALGRGAPARRRTSCFVSRSTRACSPSARTNGCASCCDFRDGPRLATASAGSRPVSSRVRRRCTPSRSSSRSAGTTAFGSTTPVVTADGLVGTVSRVSSRTARVTLLTDDQSAVSAVDLATDASGIVRPGHGPRAPLRLDRVPKEAVVRVGDTVVTSGWRSSRLASLYPKGIRIGRVTSVGRTDTDLYTQVQVEPFADLTALEAVLVLVPGRARRTVSTALRVAPLVFVAAVLQVARLLRGAAPRRRAGHPARRDRGGRASSRGRSSAPPQASPRACSST